MIVSDIVVSRHLVARTGCGGGVVARPFYERNARILKECSVVKS